MSDKSSLTLETLVAVAEMIKTMPPLPKSINFASGLDAECAMDAWEAKTRNGDEEPINFQGIPVKVNPVLPDNVMMFLYSDRMTFFNVMTGKSWEIKNPTYDFVPMRRMT